MWNGENMKVTIRNPDGSRTDYYGVQDFQMEGLSQVRFFYPVESPWEEQEIEGDVLAAIDSTAIPPEAPEVGAEEGKEIIDRRDW